MIEIILTVCAIANPANCEEKHLQFAWNGSIQQCMMAAQPYIAQWIGQHPAWGQRSGAAVIPAAGSGKSELALWARAQTHALCGRIQPAQRRR